MTQIIDDLPPSGEKVWFIIRQDSHEGPYDLSGLQDKLASGEVSPQALVWARGWPEALGLKRVLEAYEGKLPAAPMVDSRERDQLASTPRPSPTDTTEAMPSLREPRETSSSEEERLRSPSNNRWLTYAVVALVLGLGVWVSRELRPVSTLVRPAEMRLEHFRQLEDEFNQLSRPVPIPRVVVAADYGKLWMVDRSNQPCDYHASFHSDAESNLSAEPVAFQTETTSSKHWLMFDRLSFSEGQRLVPGRYELKLTRRNCSPEGVAGLWSQPDRALSVAFAVDVYHGSAQDLAQRLEQISRKRLMDEMQKAQKAREAWRDVGEKLRTLSAVASQIQQGFQALLDRKLPWPARLSRVVEQYTKRHGGFLTNFTVKNDEDFAVLAAQDINGKVELMGQQPLINAHAKRIGFISMTLIEKLVGKEAPNRRLLQDWLTALEQDFGVEREKLRLAAEQALQASQPPSP